MKTKMNADYNERYALASSGTMVLLSWVYRIKGRHIFCFLLCIIIFSFLSYRDNTSLVTPSTPTSLSSNPAQGEPVYLKEAQNKSSVSGAAYIFLALGAQAYQMNCPAAIETLVRYGGWDGDVYLLTDQMHCFDADKIAKHAGMSREKLHYVKVDDDFSHGGVDFIHPKVGARDSRVRSFGMKTRLFDFVPDERIKILAYADCDILFGIQGCASEFVSDEYKSVSWQNVSIKLTNYVLNNDSTLRDIHAGSFVVHREHSKEMMRLWKEQINKRVDEGDNDAFMTLYHKYQKIYYGNSSGSAPVHYGTKKTNPMHPGVIFRRGYTSGIDHQGWFEKFTLARMGEFHCMNHISKARCERYGREGMERYVEQFRLRSHGTSYYCTHPYLKSFQYGWFPLALLPGCPKLESLL